jgi:sugar phosphate isomerase/epimerase
MIISGRTQVLSQYSLSESLRLIKKVGFQGVEISMFNSKFQFRPDLLEDYVIEYNKNLLEELNLILTSVSCHCDFIYQDEGFENLKKTIGKVKMYGSNILLFSGASSINKGKEEWKLMISRLQELVNIAEYHGVILAEEFEPGFVVGTTEDLLRLFNEIPSEALAANLDLGHVFLCDAEPMKSIQQLGRKIAHVHIENMRRGVHDHLIPSEGDMYLPDYVEALSKIGFRGGMALDIYKYDYLKVAPKAIQFIKDLIPG